MARMSHFTSYTMRDDNTCSVDLRSPDTCKLEKILTSPPLSLTLSTKATYFFLVATSRALNKSQIDKQ